MPINDRGDKDDIMQMMQGFPPAANHQVLLANWREPGIARWSFNHLRQLPPEKRLFCRDEGWQTCL